MSRPHPIHEGERVLQRRVGSDERVAAFAERFIRDHMPDQHRSFFAELPFLIVAAVDRDGAPWAGIWTGAPGFLESPHPQVLRIHGGAPAEDPTHAAIAEGASIGLLGIQLETRRRNRMNGEVHRAEGSLEVQVEHSFGNCPQYIQRRALRPATPSGQAPLERKGLSEAARALIRRSDTFFVASYVDLPHGRQVDASHRGGKPGFVHIAPDGTLTVPDFAGNRLFNTLGNFLANPVGGLLFIDWERGDLLQLTGRVELILEGDEIGQYRGAQQLWRFRSTTSVFRPGALALRGELVEMSPNLRRTGSWERP